MKRFWQKLFDRLGLVTKYDANEYARRFLSGDDLPASGDGWYSPEAAMRIAAVYACVTIRSQTVASLPITVYERVKSGGQREVPEHPIARLMAEPNRRQTTYEWVQQQIACLDLRGNGISLKAREGGQVTELIPVHPSNVVLEQYENALIYRVTRNGQSFRVISEDVLHLANLTLDGYWGMSPIAAGSDAVLLARKIQKYGVSVLETGGAKRVLLKFPGNLSNDARKQLKESWAANGKDSARTAVLEEGGDAVTVGMNADEAQYLETRQMSIADIARLYTMPLMLLGVHDKTSSYASTEQFDLLFGKHTIRPICKRLEARIDRDLIADPRYFCKFNMDALLRGDIQTRTEALARQFERGALTIDEWRELENRNPTGLAEGRQHFVPVNLTPVERLAESQQPKPAEDEEPMGGLGGSDNAERSHLEPFARDLAIRITNKEIRELPRLSDVTDFQEQHRVYIYRSIRPLFIAAGIEDEDRREAMATQLVSTLTAGVETDPEHRQAEILAILMAAVEPNAIKSAGWHVAAAAARRAIEEAAASDEKPRMPGGHL